jgi:hypothetical protein
VTQEVAGARDVLVLSKTVAANDFPVERPSVLGVDRETGALLRLSPFPWKGTDTDPPVPRWGWIRVEASRDERDPRADTVSVRGAIEATGYVDAKEGWRLRWPFVRPHLRGSAESIIELARAHAASAGFVRPQPDIDIVQLPLRLRFRCASEDCTSTHELPVLDWELHALVRATRERHGAQWATRFRESWGAGLTERFDVHILLSAYAQAPSKLYAAGLFYPPRSAEDEHQHMHHVAHREHAG